MKYNALLLVTIFFIGTNLALAQQPAPFAPRMISVTGEAKEEIVPDQAVLSGELVSKAKKLSAAKEENDKLAKRVLAIAKQFDIPKEKISASNVRVGPEYVWDQATQKQNITGYVVSRSLSITMDTLDIHERLLSALLENGIDQINGVNFALSKPEIHANQLRVKALQNAQSQAQMLAEAAGAKLGKVVYIATNSVNPPGLPIARPMAMARSNAEASAPSLPGVINLEENVSVTFELE